MSSKRPLLGTGLEDEKIIEYSVEEFPWQTLVADMLQVNLFTSEIIFLYNRDFSKRGSYGTIQAGDTPLEHLHKTVEGIRFLAAVEQRDSGPGYKINPFQKVSLTAI